MECLILITFICGYNATNCPDFFSRIHHSFYSIPLTRDGDKMAPAVEKKIAELEMGLLHLQQNIDIPEITLQVHPAVAQVTKLRIVSIL